MSERKTIGLVVLALVAAFVVLSLISAAAHDDGALARHSAERERLLADPEVRRELAGLSTGDQIARLEQIRAEREALRRELAGAIERANRD